MHHRLHLDHVAKSLFPFVQKVSPCLLLILISLRLDVEVKCLSSFESGSPDRLTQANANVDRLQGAKPLAGGLCHVHILGSRVVAQGVLIWLVMNGS